MKKPDCDIIIVGAGLAGLAAANRARALGLHAEVFEASDGVGGRVRTDNVNGYLCDRGFQLINPEYPALKTFYQPEKFHQLPKSVDLLWQGKNYRLGDFRNGDVRAALNFATGKPWEKLRFIKYLMDVRSGKQNLFHEKSFEAEMVERKIGDFYSRVIRPFSLGVTLDMPERVSSSVARELINYFLSGNPGLPYGGVGEVSKSLSSGLSVHLNSPVSAVGENFVRVGRKKFSAKAIVVATEASAALQLFGIRTKNFHAAKRAIEGKARTVASATWYHSADDFDIDSTLRIDASQSGPVINSIAISKLAPEYAPTGKVLIASTVLGAMGKSHSKERVETHLAKIWKRDIREWSLIAHYWIDPSLPVQERAIEKVKSQLIASNIAVAGDYLALGAQQGAMESGIEAVDRLVEIL